MSLSEESKKQCSQLLLDMRQDLLDQMRAKHQLSRDRDYRGDLGDVANTVMAAEYDYFLSDRLRERLWLIEEALEALAKGEYGICDECEEYISEKRLLLLPFTRFCVRCQSEIERQAKMRGKLAA